MGADHKPERVSTALIARGYDLDSETGRVGGLVCPDCGVEALELNEDESWLNCANCQGRQKAPEFVFRQGPAPARRSGPAQKLSEALRAAEPPMPSPETETARPAEPAAANAPAAAAAPPRAGFGEHLIISLLALAFLAAGLLATAMSGFANYQAFGAMVDDPLQARVWAWTGVIASVCSFGGFTFVYWHSVGGRAKEAVRAGVFAIAGAATSLVGTQMYMAGTEADRQAEMAAAISGAPLLEAEIADLRAQLSGIPPETRSIEGLEAYIAEVERVGRTHQKPYRDALDELGQARRRAELEARLDTARAELAAMAPLRASAGQAPAPPARSWFFAAMLEVFSSQATSIAFVALMILSGRTPRGP